MSTQASYGQVADEYARRNWDELKRKPLDRQLSDRLAASDHADGSLAQSASAFGFSGNRR